MDPGSEILGGMDKETAIKEVIKIALAHDGVVKGIREATKYLDKAAELCLLSKSCDEQSYVKLIKALCNEHGIKLLEVEDSKTLGEMAGLCKIDKEGKPRKVVGCSCVVIRHFGRETQAHDVLRQYLKIR
ncbi:unnamed protein product [Gordionus sp. m RMFG-2023]